MRDSQSKVTFMYYSDDGSSIHLTKNLVTDDLNDQFEAWKAYMYAAGYTYIDKYNLSQINEND